MSGDTEALVQQILSTLQNNINPTITNTNATITALNTEAQSTMRQAQALMTRLDPVIDSITRIENFVFALLIVIAVMLLAMFVFWFFRHVYPLMRKQHTHVHTSDNVIRDLTDTPVRVQPATNTTSFEQSVKRDFGSGW